MAGAARAKIGDWALKTLVVWWIITRTIATPRKPSRAPSRVPLSMGRPAPFHAGCVRFLSGRTGGAGQGLHDLCRRRVGGPLPRAQAKAGALVPQSGANGLTSRSNA